jgi:hypothetical protein
MLAEGGQLEMVALALAHFGTTRNRVALTSYATQGAQYTTTPPPQFLYSPLIVYESRA